MASGRTADPVGDCVRDYENIDSVATAKVTHRRGCVAAVRRDWPRLALEREVFFAAAVRHHDYLPIAGGAYFRKGTLVGKRVEVVMSSTWSGQAGGAASTGHADACEVLNEPLSRVMTLLGKRWTGVVLGTLMPGPVHFNDLRRGIPGISDRLLTERLVELASLGLVVRTVVDKPPLRVQYKLTEHGYALRPALNELTQWAQAHLSPVPPPAR